MQGRRIVRAVVVGVAVWAEAAATGQRHMSPGGAEGGRGENEQLPQRDAQIAQGLIERAMPELLEEFLRDRPAVHRVLLARAYVRAAGLAGEAARREADLAAAEAAYRTALAATESAEWRTEVKRRFAAARWRVELGDLLLRERCAAELDELEIGGGLAPPPEALAGRLDAAIEEYRAADRVLAELGAMLSRDEESFLVEGLAEIVPAIGQSCSLNLGWALTYRARLRESGDPDRAAILTEALRRFDEVAHRTRSQDEKLNSLVGAATAFRAAGRVEDARKVLRGVERMSPPADLAARVRYELGQTALAARQFDEAAREFEGLAASGASGADSVEGAGGFYARLAPLRQAYALIQKAADGGADAEGLRRQAFAILEEVSRRGGPWPRIADVYLAEALPEDADAGSLSAAERRVLGSRLMARGRYEEAARALRAYLDDARSAAGGPAEEARFDLGTCLVALGRDREAAELLARLAEEAQDTRVAERAARSAMEAWQRAAARSGLADDYAALAAVCQRMRERNPTGPEAAEASWVEATALRQGGRLEEALTALEQVGAESPHDWEAKVAAAQCRQTLWSRLPATERAGTTARQIQGLVEEWDRLAGALTGAAARDEARRAELESLRDVAALSAAELLVDQRMGRYAEALQRAAAIDRPGLDGAARRRLAGVRIGCYRRMGDYGRLNAALEAYLKDASPGEEGRTLIELAAEIEGAVLLASRSGEASEARRLAGEAVPIVRRLARWVESQPDRAADVPVVRFSLARMLVEADRGEEAAPLLEELVSAQPEHGAYRRALALAYEQMARDPSVRSSVGLKAEEAWAALLRDEKLRDTAPGEYWEARYHWLRWQLERGRAEQVAKGIEAERVWHPELGGPPWRERLLDLAERARVAAASSGASRAEADGP